MSQKGTFQCSTRPLRFRRLSLPNGSCLCSLVKTQNAPKRLPRSFAGWIVPTYKFNENELVRLGGTDAATYLRLQRFGRLINKDAVQINLFHKHCMH